MNTDLIQQVIADQRAMISRKERGLPRMVNKDIHLKSKLISVITGVRRAGKSILTLQLADNFPAFHYINFDDERLIGFTVDDFNPMLIEMKKTNQANVIILDEIQLITGWERFARRLHDGGYKVFITGSNAKLLSSELATHLTGRYLKTELFPFSLREFLGYKNIDPADNTSDNKARILAAFDHYLLHGGFPEYLNTGFQEVLKHIYDDILYRDLIVRFGIRNVSGFKNLAHYLFTNFTSETGYLPLANLLGFSSSNSVKDYINILREGYLVFDILGYDYSLKRQYSSNRKIYVVDNGLRNTVSFRTSSDSGKLLENAVFVELLRQGNDVWYFRSKNNKETDFLISPDKPILIQVCSDLSNPLTREREVNSLSACMKELGRTSGLILSKNEEDEINAGEGRIKVIPAWKWMLFPEILNK